MSNNTKLEESIQIYDHISITQESLLKNNIYNKTPKIGKKETVGLS